MFDNFAFKDTIYTNVWVECKNMTKCCGPTIKSLSGFYTYNMSSVDEYSSIALLPSSNKPLAEHLIKYTKEIRYLFHRTKCWRTFFLLRFNKLIRLHVTVILTAKVVVIIQFLFSCFPNKLYWLKWNHRARIKPNWLACMRFI